MRSEVVTRVSFGNEGTQFDILPGNLLRSDILIENTHEFLMRGYSVQVFYGLNLLFIEVFFESAEHSIVSHLGGVGNKGEYGILHLIADSLENGLEQQLPEFSSFAVDVSVRTSAEIDSFK